MKDTLAFRVQRSSKDKLVLEERPDDEAPRALDKKESAPHADVAQSAASEASANAGPAQAALSASPSLGAIQAAVGSAMAAARSCLAGQDAGSKARVTFGSNGRVSAVDVSGPAAGTPAEACLRSALSAARVSPFSDPSYSVSLTVRPP
jgi:hypothetical protein